MAAQGVGMDLVTLLVGIPLLLGATYHATTERCDGHARRT